MRWAVLALGGLVALVVVAIGWRMWLQFRRTGNTGFRGISWRPPETVSAVIIVVGTVAVALSPIVELVHALSPFRFLDRTLIHAAGATLFAAGFVIIVRAQLDMGAAWRIGLDATEVTPLVTNGAFRYVRNPIYSGVLTVFAGVCLMVPNILAFVGFALVVLGLELHVRFVEEPYLSRLHGERYRNYVKTVGRFVPLARPGQPTRNL